MRFRQQRPQGVLFPRRARGQSGRPGVAQPRPGQRPPQRRLAARKLRGDPGRRQDNPRNQHRAFGVSVDGAAGLLFKWVRFLMQTIF